MFTYKGSRVCFMVLGCLQTSSQLWLVERIWPIMRLYCFYLFISCLFSIQPKREASLSERVTRISQGSAGRNHLPEPMDTGVENDQKCTYRRCKCASHRPRRQMMWKFRVKYYQKYSNGRNGGCVVYIAYVGSHFCIIQA